MPRVNKALISAAAAVTLLLAACGEAPQQAGGPPGMGPQGPVEVGVATVETKPVPVTTELPGRTSAFRVAEVRPQVNGIIQKRLFQEGGTVKEGDQLYQIDPAPYEATVASAKAELSEAEANLKAQRAKAKRYRELVKTSTVSQQALDDAIAAEGQGEARVAAARASLQKAQIDLGYTKVYAPISGRIGKSSVTEGALVTANQANPLATIQQLDPIYVDITQSVSQLMRLRRDIAEGRVLSTNGRTPVTLEVEGVEYGIPGELQFADVTVDTGTNSVLLRAVVPNPNQDLLPGLFVRARVLQGAREDAILISQRAVVRQPDGSAMVWVVGDDGTVNPRPVQAAQAIGSDWLVSAGLKPGERIVMEGLQKIRPGAAVKPVPMTAAQVATGQSAAPRKAD
ncbi:efflux RND transporter periplasmic adaptor subunit [Rhodospirillum centenum]|uniref:Acriflavine resistance protein E n=1 Tax=Rhodospirillum centenum (strain ATCC 51521 / SW) TaxID=414684 RepID=B6IY68_RHOCS|nr:efflux RND transporter periplasmic adaptor subunit [Rhodospirillum centenum]ACJ01242.1 acriflavine resistance protein E [Rhodospirillum centenum SW]